MSASLLTRVQAALAAAAVLGAAGVVGYLVFAAPGVAFLPPGQEAGWIGFRFPVTAGVIRTVDPPEPFVFTRRFELAEAPGAATLEASALHRLEIELNGEPLVSEPRDAWREPVGAEVSDRLRSGRNELEVRVRNRMGPGLLRMRIHEKGRLLVETDERWTVRPPSGGSAQASFVDDTRIHPQSLRAPTPAEILRERAGGLAALLAIGTALAYLLESRALRPFARHGPQAILAAVSLGWLALLVARLGELPLEVGFDAEGHLAYAAFLREQGALPLAPDGLSMFHPPLFYGLLAGLTALAGVEVGAPDAALLHRLVPMTAGLASVWMVWLAARRLFEGDALRTGLAVATAGLLPMHVYMSAFVSNESTATLASSAVLAAALGVLGAERVSGGRLAALAVLGGLALLSKYSAFVMVPVALGMAALRPWLVEHRGLPRSLGLGAALAGGALAVGGWFYARNWIRLGTPFPWSWSREAGGPGVWWHLPGYHTLDYFTRFGESLRHPLFAGFHSYADGVYSTLWGDALAAGHSQPLANPAGWALDWMLLGYLLALPVTLLLGAGLFRAIGHALRSEGPGRRLGWTLLLLALFAMGLSHLVFSIRYPSYAASKAFYALPALLPLALVAALGLAWLPEHLRGERLRPVRALYFGALLTLASVLALSFRG